MARDGGPPWPARSRPGWRAPLGAGCCRRCPSSAPPAPVQEPGGRRGRQQRAGSLGRPRRPPGGSAEQVDPADESDRAGSTAGRAPPGTRVPGRPGEVRPPGAVPLEIGARTRPDRHAPTPGTDPGRYGTEPGRGGPPRCFRRGDRDRVAAPGRAAGPRPRRCRAAARRRRRDRRAGRRVELRAEGVGERQHHIGDVPRALGGAHRTPSDERSVGTASPCRSGERPAPPGRASVARSTRP